MDECILRSFRPWALALVLAGISGCGGGGSSSDALSVSKSPDPEPTPITYPAPTMESAEWQGDNVALSWSYPGELPEDGFDIIVNGTDTNEVNRTSTTTALIGPLNPAIEQCFQVQARYPQVDQFPASAERCVPADGEDAESVNTAPEISGLPAPVVAVGDQYRFTPTASDADADPLTFSVMGLPLWAAFDAATGVLSGTPGDADLGRYEDIVISVSDSQTEVALAAFAIDVVAAGTASITLQWTPPTKREDGTPLDDLAGYKVYWGQDADQLDRSEDVGNGGVASYAIDGLVSGTWYLGVTAYDDAGMESRMSDIVEAVVN